MLRLVHPAREGQEDRRPSKRRRATVSLTAEETRHLRATLRNLARAYGSWSCLAEVMGVKLDLLRNVLSRAAGPGVAIRAARAGGMSVEAILSGALTEAGRCKTCGARIGAQATAGGAS